MRLETKAGITKNEDDTMCNETVYNNNKMSLSNRIHVFNEGVNHISF